MKYEVPSIEVELLNIEDIVRTSLTDGGMGDNDGVGGDGSKPWEQSKDIEKLKNVLYEMDIYSIREPVHWYNCLRMDTLENIVWIISCELRIYDEVQSKKCNID